jgi:hypothetical protein
MLLHAESLVLGIYGSFAEFKQLLKASWYYWLLFVRWTSRVPADDFQQQTTLMR